MLSPHIIHLFMHPAFERAADFKNYRISTIVHKEVVDKMPEEFRRQFTEIAILDVPHNMNLNEYDHAMDKITGLADHLAQRHGRPEAIVGLFEHVTLPAAKLRTHFGLPGTTPKVAELCRDKVKMKAALEGSTIKFPRFLKVDPTTSLDSLAAQLKMFPGKLIYKPRSQAASEGIHVFQNSDEATNFIRAHGIDASYQFEEFIEGRIAHFDGVVRDGQLRFFSASEYMTTCLEFVDSAKPLVSITLDDPAIVGEARRFTETVLDRLELRDSVFHLEAFHDGNGGFTFLEIGGRFGGAGVSSLIQKAYGVDLVNEALLADLGKPSGIDEPFMGVSRPGAAAWLYMPMPTKSKFTVGRIDGEDQLPKSVFHSERPKVGDQLNDMPMPFSASGKFFLKGESTAAVRQDCEHIMSVYRVQPEELE